jgi:hypothetical protein
MKDSNIVTFPINPDVVSKLDNDMVDIYMLLQYCVTKFTTVNKELVEILDYISENQPTFEKLMQNQCYAVIILVAIKNIYVPDFTLKQRLKVIYNRIDQIYPIIMT